MATYSMDELLTQRESALAFGVDVTSIEIEIALRADEMADEVEAVLAQPDERPFDWEVDGDE